MYSLVNMTQNIIFYLKKDIKTKNIGKFHSKEVEGSDVLSEGCIYAFYILFTLNSGINVKPVTSVCGYL